MNLQRHGLMKKWYQLLQNRKRFSNVPHSNTVNNLCKHLKITENVAQHLVIKHPVINKIEDHQMRQIIDTLHELGFAKDILIDEPQLFSFLPITLKYRFLVLEECGINNVTPDLLKRYLTIMKQRKIGNLRNSGLISGNINIENKLASYITQFPTSLTSSITENVNELSLFTLRLKIIQQHLELVLDLSTNEFYRGIETYPTVKHRPLQVIAETLSILQSQFAIPTSKIKSNMYLVHADAKNLKNILHKFRYIGGIDIKEVIRLHPKIAMKNYETLLEIRNILKHNGISDEAQRRCFDIYTLSSKTVQERLERAKEIPEFNTFYKHPRFLKMIHYNKTAMKRIQKLYSYNKKCLSLNILSGSLAHYETFEKAPGDRLGKGKDLIFCLTQSWNLKYKSHEIRYAIKRHPFWINIPLVQVKHVFNKLCEDFTPEEIYENCPIVLYPWSKVKEVLDIYKKEKVKSPISHFFGSIDIRQLNNSQKLSLVLYVLEKKHYFTGNGVWMEDKKSPAESDLIAAEKFNQLISR